MPRTSRRITRVAAAALGLAAMGTGPASAAQAPVDEQPPSRPAGLSATQILPSTARLEWPAATDDVGVVGYDIYRSDDVVGSSTEAAFQVTQLGADAVYTFSVRARDAAGNRSEASPGVTFRTPATDSPTTPELELGLPFDLAGAASIKSLVRGTVPLSGVLLDTRIDAETGSFSGVFGLGAATARLTALGILPVVATVLIDAQQALSGTLSDGTLVASTVVRIKLPLVTLFGLPLVAGGNCQTSKPSSIRLRSNGAGFSVERGGTLTGTFGISNLTGCGALSGLVSPITASNGNALVVRVAPQA